MKNMVIVPALVLMGINMHAMKDTVCKVGSKVADVCRDTQDKSGFCRDVTSAVDKHCKDGNSGNSSNNSKECGNDKK